MVVLNQIGVVASGSNPLDAKSSEQSWISHNHPSHETPFVLPLNVSHLLTTELVSQYSISLFRRRGRIETFPGEHLACNDMDIGVKVVAEEPVNGANVVISSIVVQPDNLISEGSDDAVAKGELYPTGGLRKFHATDTHSIVVELNMSPEMFAEDVDQGSEEMHPEGGEVRNQQMMFGASTSITTTEITLAPLGVEEGGFAERNIQAKPVEHVILVPEEEEEEMVESFESHVEDFIDMVVSGDGVDGVLLGVGSCVESCGLRITEIAGTGIVTAVVVEEPLITPPAEVECSDVSDTDSILLTSESVLVTDTEVENCLAVDAAASDKQESGLRLDRALDDHKRPECAKSSAGTEALDHLGVPAEVVSMEESKSNTTAAVSNTQSPLDEGSNCISNMIEVVETQSCAPASGLCPTVVQSSKDPSLDSMILLEEREDSSRGLYVVGENDRKRGREEGQELDEVGEDKTSKAHKKISNGETTASQDVEMVDNNKKRSRDCDSDAPTTAACVSQPSGEQEDILKSDNKHRKMDSAVAGPPRYKKRKIALFLGYCGAGYQGMQKNPGAITIEGELEEALFRAGAIAESNYGDPKKLDWRRAARTDKGVSAVGQVVSGSFFVDPPGLVERLNSHLPKQIRVYGYKRVTASFNAKKLCDRRKYEYVLPIYAFDPTVHLDRESVRAESRAQAQAALDVVMSASEGGVAVSMDTVMNEDKVSEGQGKPSSVETSVTSTQADVTTSSLAGLDEIPSIKVDETGKVDPQVLTPGVVLPSVDTATENLLPLDEVTPSAVPIMKRTEVVMASVVVEKSNLEMGALTEDRKAIVDAVVAPEEVEITAEAKKQALDEKVKNSTFEFGEEASNRLNRILRHFVGNHNFHNFTARTNANDPSANRYIVSFDAENVFTADGTKFVRCTVVGQSFMLHQIRKMIGLAVAIMRGYAPESFVVTALRRDTKVNVPMAPELGLFLEECYFTSYNRRWHATHEEVSLNSFTKDTNEFKKEFIYPHIVSTEARDSTCALWLHSINDRHFPDLLAAREMDNLKKLD